MISGKGLARAELIATAKTASAWGYHVYCECEHAESDLSDAGEQPRIGSLGCQ